MLGTAPSGSVQLQDYCVRPEKNGELFFQSLSAFASDPRRRAEAPVNTYSALNLLQSYNKNRNSCRIGIKSMVKTPQGVTEKTT